MKFILFIYLILLILLKINNCQKDTMAAMDVSLDNPSSTIDKFDQLNWEGKPPVIIRLAGLSIPINRGLAYKKSVLLRQFLDELPDIDVIELPSFLQLPYLTHDSIGLMRYIQIFIDTIDGRELKKPFPVGTEAELYGSQQNANFINEIALNPVNLRDLITISNYLIISDLCSMLMVKFVPIVERETRMESCEDYHARLLSRLELV